MEQTAAAYDQTTLERVVMTASSLLGAPCALAFSLAKDGAMVDGKVRAVVAEGIAEIGIEGRGKIAAHAGNVGDAPDDRFNLWQKSIGVKW